MGNRLLRDGQTQDADFDTANRLLKDENFTHAYDANGNRIKKTDGQGKEVYLKAFQTVAEARAGISGYLEFY